MKSQSLWTKYTSIFLLPFVIWITLYPSWAQAAESYSAQGKDFGSTMLAGQSTSSYDEDSGAINLDTGDSSPVNLDVNELFPGLAESEGNTTDIASLYEDEDAIESGVDSTVDRLHEEDSATGKAFRTVYGGMTSSSRPDYRNDPVWGQTDTTLEKVFAGEFSDCERTTITRHTDGDEARVPEYHNCERIIKSPTCEARRVVSQLDYTIGSTCEPGESVAGFHGYKSYHDYVCGPEGETMIINGHYTVPYAEDYQTHDEITGEHAVYFGTCEDQGAVRVCTYSGGSWRRHHPNFGHIANTMERFLEVHAQSSDIIEILEYQEDYVDTDAHITHNPPGCDDQDSMCQVDDSQWECVEVDNHRVINGVELTVEALQFMHEMGEIEPLYPGDDLSEVCWHAVAPRDCDYNVGQMDCWTDPQGEEHCPENDGENVDETGVDPDTGVNEQTTCKVYEDDPNCVFVKSECTQGAESENGTCYVFTDTYDCGYSETFEDVTVEEEIVCGGDYTCPEGNCVTHEAQENTSFNRAASNLQAAQYAMEDMDCEMDADGNIVGSCRVFSAENYQCKVAVGGWQDCCDQPVEQDIGTYMTMLGATSSLMSAQAGIGSAVDEGVPWGTWNDVGMGFSEATAGQTVLGNAGRYYNIINGAINGDWMSVAQGAGEMVIKAAGKAVVKKLAQTAIGEFVKEQIMAKLRDWMVELVGENIAGMIAGAFGGGTGVGGGSMIGGAGAAPPGMVEAGTGAVQQTGAGAIGSMIGSAVTIVGWIYLIYQIANIIVSLVYKCEEEEFELATKKAMKTCTYVGSYCASEVLGACVEKRESYCCFESPLPRIIMEQARKQLDGVAGTFGDPEFPNCEGLTMTQLGGLDWDQIDLSEWMGLLQTSGNLPSASDYDLSMDGLTGTGSALNLNLEGEGDVGENAGTVDIEGQTYDYEFQPRSDVKTRTNRRLEGVPVEDNNQDLRQGLWEERPTVLDP